MARDYVLQPFRPLVDLRIDYESDLNDQQRAAATALPGPALVIAGAGSGKTRTLIYRVAFLLEQGIPPERILLLTFTNKAAREMMQRVRGLLGGDLSALWGGTFHSVGARLLRRHADLVGLRRDFSILDREDAVTLFKTCIAEANVDTKSALFPKPEVLINSLSMAVNRRESVGDSWQREHEQSADLAPVVENLARRFRERKLQDNLVDFDDLLAWWLRLLEENEELREHYQRRFQFLLIDEYQDTNQIQSDLIDLIARRHGNIMAVGDDSQSIYSWRGANFLNILEFPVRYPNAQTYRIEINYRSTPEILRLANAAIAMNRHQFAKKLRPVCPSGPQPILVPCGDGHEQAAFVAQRMLELRDEGVDLERMAVLYRSHFHTLELQMELTRRGIPFSVTSGIRFFEQAHIKDVAAYPRLIANPRDELSFKRMVQLLPGVGGKTAERLWQHFREALQSHEIQTPVQDHGATQAPLASAMSRCKGRVPKKSAVGWAQLTATISELESDALFGRPGDLIRHIVAKGYDEYLEMTYPNFRQRLEDLDQLANFALQFENTTDFLTQVSLMTNLEAKEDRQADAPSERVHLSTVHQAKGLEFDIVFVIMLCDGLFPSYRSLDDSASEEEERRLFYVAVTRARRELYLSYPLIRFSQGRGGESVQSPSRFLTDLPEDCREEWSLTSFDHYS